MDEKLITMLSLSIHGTVTSFHMQSKNQMGSSQVSGVAFEVQRAFFSSKLVCHLKVCSPSFQAGPSNIVVGRTRTDVTIRGL